MATFSQQMKKWAEKTNRSIEKTVEDTFVNLSTTMLIRTPVGDPSLWQSPPPPTYVPGSLVNNWFSSIIGPIINDRRPQNASGSDSLAQIDLIGSKAPGNIAFFVNPLPYARRVEFGWSTQAPQGMVRLTVNDFQNTVKRSIRENRR